MSEYAPQATEISNLSYILLLEPEPVGTKFQVAADLAIGSIEKNACQRKESYFG